MHGVEDLIACKEDITGNVGRHIDGSDGVHAGYGVETHQCLKSGGIPNKRVWPDSSQP